MNQLMSERLAESMAEVRVANAALEQRNEELDRLNRELGHLATHDKLTGLHNRHFIVHPLLRQGDFPGRHGGEEFILVLPKADSEAAAKLAERVRQRVEEAPLTEGRRPSTAPPRSGWRNWRCVASSRRRRSACCYAA